jgi:two-component system CheB/CheR fusion protein
MAQEIVPGDYLNENESDEIIGGGEIIPSTPFEQQSIEEILRKLFNITNVDFGHYRQTTILRRLERRIILCKQKSYADYLSYIDSNPDEVERLYDDLLISYTEFFREPNVFETLKQTIFPALVENRSAKMPIRIWIPGCSTGEEVYSMAIAFQEYLQESNTNANNIKAQFFGTDLNPRHISFARAALYTNKVRKNISANRIEQYFDQNSQGVKVTKHIREMCVFAVQNITQDSPFSNMDMVSCRNVLIYFDAAFQELVIPLFHFSLRQGGYLLLGSSESMGRFPELFTHLDPKINLYTKRFTTSKSLHRFPMNQFSMKIKNGIGHTTGAVTDNINSRNVNKQIDDVLLNTFTPPSILVDSGMHIRQFRGKMFPFLQPVHGEASLKLSKMTTDGLMPELYLAIEEAKKKQVTIKKKEVSFKHGDAISIVDISIIPVMDHQAGEQCFLIVFEMLQAPHPVENNDSVTNANTDEQIEILRNELQATKEHLQSIIEEKDEVNQELWASNEEVQSANEELQSVNEEMEAAKEELESSNEELLALNEELRAKTFELKSAKDFSENIIETANAIVVTLDINGIITTFNNYASRLTGYRKDEVISRFWFDILLPPKIQFSIEEMVKSLIKKSPDALQQEYSIVTKNGSERLINWSNCILRDSSGTVTGILCIGIDFTDRKLAEEALRQSEFFFKESQRAGFIGSYKTNFSEGVWESSEVLEQIAGIDKNYPRTIQSWFDLIHPDDCEMMNRYLKEEVIAKHKSFNKEYRIIRKSDNAVRWVNGLGESSFDTNGNIRSLIGTMQDITERKRIEESLRETQAILQAAMDQSHAGIAIADAPSGKLRYVNKAGLMIGGGTTENLVDNVDVNKYVNSWKLFDVDGNALTVDAIPVVRAITYGEQCSREFIIRRNISDDRIVWANAGPITNAQGVITAAVVVFLDITDRKRAEEALQNAHKLESLGVLAGGIAHDFNNLLGGIFGNIELAKGECRNTKASQYLSKAVSTIDRARGLTQQLITFAKGGAPTRVLGNFYPLVQEVAQFALSGSNVSISYELKPDLWHGTFDKTQISQVIENIIINAVQAMPMGGTIVLSAENVVLESDVMHNLSKGNYVKIAIKDMGIGIPTDILPKIFDPFFTTKGMGRGLGLSTCYSIIKRHAGHIFATSVLGKGSTFVMYLPAVNEELIDNVNLEVEEHKGMGKILVMDDEDVIKHILGDMLKLFGYEVLLTQNGQNAIAVYKNEVEAGNSLVALILDLTVPGGMGGKEAIAEIRKLDRHIPAFVASGYADDPAMITPEKYGFTGSIQKPFRKSELSELLEIYLRGKRSES